MEKSKYRLSDYIITEYDNHFYTWETNIVFGEHRTGTCYIMGEILIIHSSARKKNGCLKLEYSKKLARLPFWSKTNYYCVSDSLKDAKTGIPLSNYLNQTVLEKYFHSEKSPLRKGNYHLGLYKIIVNSKGEIFWEKYHGLNKINKGSCVIKSGLLLVQSKSGSNDNMQSRKEWFCKLKSLPKWEFTTAWGRLEALKTCNQNKKIKKRKPQLPNLGYLTPRSVNSIPHLNQHPEKREQIFALFTNIPERVTQLCKFLLEKKDWLARVVSRSNAVLYTSVAFASVLLKKGAYGINKLATYIRTNFTK